MPELTLGVDLSDFVARVVVVNDAGQVLSRGQVPLASATFANGVRDAARRGIAGAGGKVSALAVVPPRCPRCRQVCAKPSRLPRARLRRLPSSGAAPLAA